MDNINSMSSIIHCSVYIQGCFCLLPCLGYPGWVTWLWPHSPNGAMPFGWVVKSQFYGRLRSWVRKVGVCSCLNVLNHCQASVLNMKRLSLPLPRTCTQTNKLCLHRQFSRSLEVMGYYFIAQIYRMLRCIDLHRNIKSPSKFIEMIH